MVCARRSRSLGWLSAIVITALLAALPAPAEEEPQQAPPAPTPTPVPGSLAAAAAGIRLQTGGGGDSGALVITDQNLKAVGAGAAISQGSAVGVQPGAQVAAPQAQVAPAAAGANDLASRLMAQQARVDELAAQLQSMDEQLAAPPTDPHYPKIDNAPQFRAPGVVDPARGQRDALAAVLEAERGKLEALRAEAAKGGVTITKAPNEAATPTR
jgi:hypothetical protein